MRTFQFQSEIWVPRPRPQVFDFFSDALNLEEITPPWLQFRVTSGRPIHMCEGTEIQYRLKIHGIPIGWWSRIAVWEPPNRFVDVQVKGPYRRWVHEHSFTDEDGGTLCRDVVEYAPIGGAVINALFVDRDVRQIFAYRTKRLREIFGEVGRGARAR